MALFELEISNSGGTKQASFIWVQNATNCWRIFSHETGDIKKYSCICKCTNVRRMERDDIVNSLIHPRCKFWQGHQWPGRDHNWKKVCGPQSSRTLPRQHLLGFWLNNHGWQHQLRNHGQKKFHANQSNVFRYPCLKKKLKNEMISSKI